MPNIIIKSTRETALSIHNVITGMTGEGSYKAAREQFQKEIITLWPELVDGTKTNVGDTRDLSFNPKQQRAMAEGILSLINDPKTTNGDYSLLSKIAGMCRLWSWVSKNLSEAAIKDFDGDIDGLPPLVDKEDETVSLDLETVTQR
jgi:hypothetical protein